MNLHTILNKYNLHTFAPDVEISEDEAQKADECCFFIRALLQRGWNIIKGDNEQYSIEEYGNQYLNEKGKYNGNLQNNSNVFLDRPKSC